MNKNINPRREILAYEPEDPLLQEDFSQELDFDVESVLQTIEQENIMGTEIDTINSTSMTVQCQTFRTSPKVPIFNNCKIGSIGNIHVHIHKN